MFGKVFRLSNKMLFVAFVVVVFSGWSKDNGNVYVAATTTTASSVFAKSPSLQRPEGKRTFEESRQNFHIHGWRWHNMCLIRDLNRLSSLASSIVPDLSLSSEVEYNDAISNLEDAAEFVIDINMKGLQRVESKIFFPWLQKRFNAGTSDNNINNTPYALEVASSTEKFINNQKDMKNKAEELLHSVQAAKTAKNPALQMQELGKVANISTELAMILERDLNIKQTKIIPAISETIPERDQKKLNTRVLMKLGVLESRIHLVGMHDTVASLKDRSEYETFRRAIPTVPQKMIPRWRKTLYEPKAGALERCS